MRGLRRGAARAFAAASLAAAALVAAPASAAAAGVAAREVAAGVVAPAGASAGGIVVPATGGAPWTAAQTAALASDIDALLAGAATVRGAHVGILAVDTATGADLYRRAPDDEFQPASTLKLLVGSAALDRLSPRFAFRTEVRVGQRTADPYDDVRYDLGGDPFLTTDDLAAAARAVAAFPGGDGWLARPKVVSVAADRYDARPYPAGWTWDDFGQSYAPRVSAAALEENLVHLIVTPAAAAGGPAVVRTRSVASVRAGDRCDDGPVPIVLARAATGAAASADTLDVALDDRGCPAVVGSIPAGAPPEDLDVAVPDPLRYAAAAAAATLQDAGLRLASASTPSASPGNRTSSASPGDRVSSASPGDRVSSASPGDRTSSASPGERATPASPGGRETPVWQHLSPSLATFLGARFWIPSDNLVGELLLKELGYVTAGTPGTTEGGVAFEKLWLRSIGVDSATVTLADGCGMSQYDRITPRDLVAILQHDWRGPNRQLVLDSLPVGGARGTIEGIAGTAAAGRVFAKTGSIMHVRGLAGYLAPLRHGAVTFAFNVDDWNGAYADLAALRARILARIVTD